jgi:serine/threonine-protein kinase
MLAPGMHLGAYEVLGHLGAGGMGEVYRAKDTKLGREVALKILPASFTNDPERVARFRREAQVLASLNHPHIAQIYGLEEANGEQFLVLELVDGESLDKRIARGPIPVDEALGIAKQIAEALEAAHEKGIIHRDLKPANIALTNDGNVKVLDFGLAKAVEATASGSNLSMSPTITTPAMMTGVGVILGTAAYMSPEQAKGRAADKRTDIWAFGCVLYEMLTGKRAFEGEDVSDTLAAVLRGEPDWTRISTEVPPYVRTLVRGCLEKNRAARPSEIATARFVLAHGSTLSGPVSQPPVLPPVPSALRRYVIPMAVGVLLTAAVASLAWWRFRPEVSERTVARFIFPLGEGQQFTNPGRQLLSVSPDGTTIVYVANRRLYLRPMAELAARPIAGTEASAASGIANPVFSPDGRWLVFWMDNALKKIAVTGGAAVTLCTATIPFGMSWDHDTIIFGQGSKGILQVSANGGKPSVVASVKDGEFAHGPQMLPDGHHVLFTIARGAAFDRWDHAQIVVQSMTSSERKTLIDGGSDGRYLPTGHLVYALGGVLLAVPFDVTRLEVRGGPTPVVEGVLRPGAAGGGTGNAILRTVTEVVSANLAGTADFSVSATGSLVYIPGPVATGPSQTKLAWIDRQGQIETLPLPAGPYEYPRIDRDGRRIAYDTDDGKDAIIWIYSLSGASPPQRLTIVAQNRVPLWSPDGTHVAFQSDREGDAGIWWQRADGTGPADRLTKAEPGTSHLPASWSPDGKTLLFDVTKGSSSSLWSLSLADKRLVAFGGVHPPNMLSAAAVSPDGRWVAYSDRAGQLTPILFVQRFPPTDEIRQIAPAGIHPVWSRDGRELFFNTGPPTSAGVTILSTEPTLTVSNPVSVPKGGAVDRGPGAECDYDIAPNGRFLRVVPSTDTTVPQIEVIENWFQELKQRVPVK